MFVYLWIQSSGISNFNLGIIAEGQQALRTAYTRTIVDHKQLASKTLYRIDRCVVLMGIQTSKASPAIPIDPGYNKQAKLN